MATLLKYHKPHDLYLAGLWHTTLGLGLFWYNVKEYDAKERGLDAPVNLRIANQSKPDNTMPSSS
jgi:hypothetical protein